MVTHGLFSKICPFSGLNYSSFLSNYKIEEPGEQTSHNTSDPSLFHLLFSVHGKQKRLYQDGQLSKLLLGKPPGGSLVVFSVHYFASN